MTPTELVHSLVQTRYAGCNCIYFCGSAARGEETEFSDVDVIVLFNSITHAQRETFREGGWLVDAQIHDPETLNYLMTSDARLGSSIVAKMIVDAVLVPRATRESDQVSHIASQIVSAGPPSQDFSGVRYMVGNIIADLKQSRDSHETLAIGVELYKILATFYFRSRQEWAVSKKMIPRALRVLDPGIEEKLHKAFLELFSGGCNGLVIEIAEDFLKPVGGPLYENFHMNYPAQARLAINRRT
jgi:Nucleotidyltransferase domain